MAVTGQDDKQPTSTDNQPPGDAAQPTAIPAPTPPAPAPAVKEPEGSDGKVVQVPHSSFKKIKDEAREEGRREAQSELEATATKHGFSSFDAALAALAAINQKPPAEPKTPNQPMETTTMPKQPKPQQPDPANAKAAREAQRLSDERTKIRKDWRASQRKNRELQRQKDVVEAERDLRDTLYQSGVKNVKYVSHLISEHIRGKSVEEVATFIKDGMKPFLENVRKEEPYLFGETVIPVTTGTNGAKPDGSNPVTPPPAKTVVDDSARQQFDARKATPDQLQERLRSLGLNPNNT